MTMPAKKPVSHIPKHYRALARQPLNTCAPGTHLLFNNQHLAVGHRGECLNQDGMVTVLDAVQQVTVLEYVDPAPNGPLSNSWAPTTGNTCCAPAAKPDVKVKPRRGKGKGRRK